MAAYKTVMVDVDGTLVFDMLHKGFDRDKSFCVNYVNGPVWLTRHDANIDLVKIFHGLGYEVIVWSRTGRDWAQLVVDAVGLKYYVSQCLTKPLYYIDDEDANGWMGSRRWLEPKLKS